MEHIVHFGITIDDDAIAKRINENVEKQVIANITTEIKKVIFARSYYSDRINEHDNSPLRDLVRKKVDEIIIANKDVILAEASKILADKLARSKAGKAILEDIQ